MADNRRTWTVILVIFIIYWGFVPAFWSWMTPRASAEIPPEWNHGQDMPITIRISSMHPNYQINLVRFYIDNQATKLDGVTGPLYAFPIYHQDPVQRWNRFTLNRFTFPRTRRFEVIVPFASMKSEGHSGPGVIAGKLDIDLDFVGSVNRYSGLGGTEMSESEMTVIPFEINLK